MAALIVSAAVTVTGAGDCAGAENIEAEPQVSLGRISART
jgi:hypothetical protein